jgi:NAD(P)-dependent dehydrogenase (short-subunit alcohol dehydrogenase family)
MNRTVLITGAAVRIGRRIAEILARRGWDVIVHAHRSTAQAEALCAELRSVGVHAWCVAGDLLAPSGPDRVFDAALDAAGHVDALINNASQFARQPLASATDADFERLWRINALAPIRLTLRLADHLTLRRASGCAVNLLDQRIAHAGSTGATPYLLSKKTLEAFTLTAAAECAPHLRVNAIAPGAVLPPVAQNAAEPAGRFPLEERPTADQVAQAAAYLLDAEAVTGQILYVDGGQHLQTTPVFRT